MTFSLCEEKEDAPARNQVVFLQGKHYDPNIFISPMMNFTARAEENEKYSGGAAISLRILPELRNGAMLRSPSENINCRPLMFLCNSEDLSAQTV